MNGFTSRSVRATAVLACLLASNVIAKEPEVEIVLTGLRTPSAVAIRSGGTAEQYEVFVADSTLKRIVKIRSDQAGTGTGTDAITGFDLENGPSALIFLDREHLVVGGHKQPAIRMYELADEATPITADNAKQVINEPAVEHVFAFARTRQNDNVPDMLVVACIGDGWSAGLGKIQIRAGTLGKFTPLFGTESLVGNSSLCVAVGEQGYIAAGQLNLDVKPKQSRLAFYDPATRKAAVSYPVPLTNLLGLAYNPSNLKLYAIQRGTESDGGGLYRIDDASEPGKPDCKAVKIAAIGEATDLAFAQDGTLYITAGHIANGETYKPGVLLRIRGEL